MQQQSPQASPSTTANYLNHNNLGVSNDGSSRRSSMESLSMGEEPVSPAKSDPGTPELIQVLSILPLSSCGACYHCGTEEDHSELHATNNLSCCFLISKLLLLLECVFVRPLSFTVLRAKKLRP